MTRVLTLLNVIAVGLLLVFAVAGYRHRQDAITKNQQCVVALVSILQRDYTQPLGPVAQRFCPEIPPDLFHRITIYREAHHP
jgi:hypothetical protein